MNSPYTAEVNPQDGPLAALAKVITSEVLAVVPSQNSKTEPSAKGAVIGQL